MIDYLIDSIIASGADSRPVVVVGPGSEMIKDHLGDRCDYAFQAEQLGTGHALRCALPVLGEAKRVLVLYGDHALVSAKTIKKLVDFCSTTPVAIVLMTVQIGDFNDWRKAFYDFGRIIRNGGGKVKEIIEKKDASEAELAVTEVNPAYYCFDLAWVRANIDKIKNQNIQGEYYLTDLIGLAISQGETVEAIPVDDPREGLGVNTSEQLEIVEGLA
jgi:bifunctional UDP-N-acetylglucosamine pyrophosphorylase/glucosamine-1-phosphate N-acetyltransferase